VSMGITCANRKRLFWFVFQNKLIASSGKIQIYEESNHNIIQPGCGLLLTIRWRRKRAFINHFRSKFLLDPRLIFKMLQELYAAMLKLLI